MNDVMIEKRLDFIESCLGDITRLMNNGGTPAYYKQQVVRRVLRSLTSNEVGYLTRGQIDARLLLNDVQELKRKVAPEKAMLKDIAELRSKIRSPKKTKMLNPKETK